MLDYCLLNQTAHNALRQTASYLAPTATAIPLLCLSALLAALSRCRFIPLSLARLRSILRRRLHVWDDSCVVVAAAAIEADEEEEDGEDDVIDFEIEEAGEEDREVATAAAKELELEADACAASWVVCREVLAELDEEEILAAAIWTIADDEVWVTDASDDGEVLADTVT